MKIVVTGTRGIPNILGGIETICEELFTRIAALDYDVTVIRRKKYVPSKLDEYKGIHLIDIDAPDSKSLETIIHTFKAICIAKRLKADIVSIQAIGPALLTPFAKMLGMKVVVTHHGFDYDRDKWNKIAKAFLKLGERMACRYADTVISTSDVIDKFVKQQYNCTKSVVIYNGIPVPNFTNDTSYMNDLGVEPKKYIFAMGRFVPEKNFHQLINVFADNFSKDYKLVLAGDADFEDDYSRELKQQAKENGVILTGFIKGERLQMLLTHARLFVLPSSHEGLPMTLLESMGYNLPIIASNIPANKNLGLPSECYFQVNDEKSMAQKLRKVLSSEVYERHYSTEKFNWDRIAEQTAAVYEKIIN
ncbi:MAG: glycosyltransferase family 4 protein [Dysgonamonadaceae bacterium]|nr:glycosyltransferase family 4 protein [Dysgonamonadaceae bacterium]